MKSNKEVAIFISCVKSGKNNLQKSERVYTLGKGLYGFDA